MYVYKSVIYEHNRSRILNSSRHRPPALTLAWNGVFREAIPAQTVDEGSDHSLNLMVRIPASLSCSPPEVGVNGEAGHLSGTSVKESAMMAESAVPEESRQHGQSARRECLVDERLLPLQRLDGGTTGQRIFASRGIGNFRVELADRSQPFCLAAVPSVERLAKDVLPAGRVVAKIKPVRDVARLPGHASVDHSARGPRVHTPDQEIRVPVMV